MKTFEEMLAYGKQVADIWDYENVIDIDCDFYVYLMENAQAQVCDDNRFFVRANCDTIVHTMYIRRSIRIKKRLQEMGLREGVLAKAFSGGSDFGHTCPDWGNILSLGIVGLKRRAAEYAKTNSDTPEKKRFYDNVDKVYTAALKYMERAYQAALESGREEMATGIRNLMTERPRNLFEAMQTILIFYMLQHTFEGTALRTLWRLDQLLYPFYEGETDQEYVDGLLRDFIRSVDSLKAEANIPFAIGGVDASGNSAVNELSYKLLEAYQTVRNSDTKLHLMCSDNTPKDIIAMALDGVRNNRNSIVFMSDDAVVKSLICVGAEEADAKNYSIVGCYECGAYGEVTCSCAARVNLPKSLQIALDRGVDSMTGKVIGLEHTHGFDTFEDVYAAFEEQLREYCRSAVQVTDLCERNNHLLHAAPFFSSTFTSAVEQGGDVYSEHTVKYNNTSVNAVGLGTCVDSLVAIRKLVFEEKKVTMEQLLEILRSNWEGAESLRLQIKNHYPKFGQGNAEADALAGDIIRILSEEINGRPNEKGGVYRLGAFSIGWRWEFGEATAASADGRRAGETLSQNTSATFGAAKYGATAHLLSVAGIGNERIPNGSICDIDLHSSAVEGENGLNALQASLKTYFDLGGFAVHYNVMNDETLRKAKQNPEQYPDLQVRLCGWNVLFSSLSEKEKDEFIARAAEAS